MWAILDKISYPPIIVIAVFMLLAPFKPMPHVVEKFLIVSHVKKWHINQAD
jgi:hypothetical protein